MCVVSLMALVMVVAGVMVEVGAVAVVVVVSGWQGQRGSHAGSYYSVPFLKAPHAITSRLINR